MANGWILRKDDRVYVFKKCIFAEDGRTVEEIEIFDYPTISSYHEDRWRERRAGNSLAYARGVWDELVENGFHRWMRSGFRNPSSRKETA